jgi:hypothetical protein
MLRVLTLAKEILRHLEPLQPEDRGWFTERRLRWIAALSSERQHPSAFQLLAAARRRRDAF